MAGSLRKSLKAACPLGKLESHQYEALRVRSASRQLSLGPGAGGSAERGLWPSSGVCLFPSVGVLSPPFKSALGCALPVPLAPSVFLSALRATQVEPRICQRDHRASIIQTYFT